MARYCKSGILFPGAMGAVLAEEHCREKNVSGCRKRLSNFTEERSSKAY